VYALSGARAAYLCGSQSVVEELRALTPPWAVSLLAQVAAVAALQDPDYYAARYAETHRLRRQFAQRLAEMTDWEILPGIANFLLCHLPEDGPDADSIVSRCRAHGLFLRNADGMGRRFAGRSIRIAVKDEATNLRIVEIISAVLSSDRDGARRISPRHARTPLAV